MRLVMRPNYRAEPLDLRGEGSTCDEKIAGRDHTLPGLLDGRGHLSWKDADTHRDVAHRDAAQPCFLHEAREALAAGLLRRESPLGHPRALRREWIEHEAAPNRRHRRETADDKAISAARDDGLLEEQAREARLPRCDGPDLGHARQDFGGAE